MRSVPLLVYRFVSRPSGPATTPSSLIFTKHLQTISITFPAAPSPGLADVSYTMLERKG
jgi:hypothetical protein